MKDSLFCVVTTVQSPTDSMRLFADRLREVNTKLIVIGDAKGPGSYDIAHARFLSLKDQVELPFKLACLLPTGHYTRKNLGYLLAMKLGATCIYETDDDNSPSPDWGPRNENVAAQTVQERGWVNIYRLFTEVRIWPRGFPLDELANSFARNHAITNDCISMIAPIQQGLTNHSPDVDAVWRLVLEAPFEFSFTRSFHLQQGAWCPFNSQSTWWWTRAFPLMYLPSYCSFRMTDIWRSLIAQRCLWELGLGVVFHGAETIQVRNDRDRLKDFVDEIPGYLHNKEFVRVLDSLNLEKSMDSVASNLFRCYEALVKAQLFPEEELGLIQVWLEDVKNIADTQ